MQQRRLSKLHQSLAIALFFLAQAALPEAAHAARRSYGAIAYSLQDDAYGWSDGWNDQTTAEKEALSGCNEHGQGCKGAVWFFNSCGAVAVGGEIVAWGQDDTKGGAEAAAMYQCMKDGGTSCKIKISHCSF